MPTARKVNTGYPANQYSYFTGDRAKKGRQISHSLLGSEMLNGWDLMCSTVEIDSILCLGKLHGLLVEVVKNTELLHCLG